MSSQSEIQNAFDSAIGQRNKSALVGNWGTDEQWLTELKMRGIDKDTLATDFNRAMKTHPNFRSKIGHQNPTNDSRVALFDHQITTPDGKTKPRQKFYFVCPYGQVIDWESFEKPVGKEWQGIYDKDWHRSSSTVTTRVAETDPPTVASPNATQSIDQEQEQEEQSNEQEQVEQSQQQEQDEQAPTP